MSVLWIAVIAASAVSFAQKWLGYQTPPELLERPRIARITTLLPIALLGALVAVQAATSGTEIVLDARLAGLGVAVALLCARAPFLVVVIGAAAAAAALRALGWS
ncbi:AzlD domain-containing protein [Brachybacterium sp. YJGR34]|uniref:AzlD domain-containing protein n=1 Tax=Brachybacterium sp. YJGR34 TaxID=2059911 RepID=UPI000E0BE812|nr:AzlD domain-containing protein [Brachybacterium sp. YJGR34]